MRATRGCRQPERKHNSWIIYSSDCFGIEMIPLQLDAWSHGVASLSLNSEWSKLKHSEKGIRALVHRSPELLFS